MTLPDHSSHTHEVEKKKKRTRYLSASLTRLDRLFLDFLGIAKALSRLFDFDTRGFRVPNVC
jgi:hypothetical protein